MEEIKDNQSFIIFDSNNYVKKYKIGKHEITKVNYENNSYTIDSLKVITES